VNIRDNQQQQPQETKSTVKRTIDKLGIPTELTQKLQTTLAFDQLLEIFSEFVRKFINYDAILYDYEPADVKIELGDQQTHNLTYNLSICDEYIGNIIFSRKTKFSDEEIKSTENLLVFLVYPLRNAVNYRQALDAALTDSTTATSLPEVTV